MAYAHSAVNTVYTTRGASRNRVMRRTPKELRAQYRLKRYLPLHITQEETTEVRAQPGTQAVVQFQAERLLPTYTTVSPPVPTGALNASVNRRTDGSLGAYNGSVTAAYFDQMYRFASSTADSRTLDTFNHRSDWTMFTNPSWRDGIAAMNGYFTNYATAKAGYTTPFKGGTLLSYYRKNSVDDVASTSDTIDPIYSFHATDYYHLSESISCTVTNNALVPTAVTFYECILAHDVRLQDGVAEDGSTAIKWGALPCPIELWRARRQMGRGEQGGIKIVGDRAGVAAGAVGSVQGDDGDGATGTRMGGPESAAAGGFTPSAGQPADIDAPNVHPGGAMLRHWYKVVPVTRVVGPGMTTTFKVHVVYNKRIPGLWWDSMMGVKGMSRAFFLVARPHKMVGATGVDEAGASGPGSRLMVMGNTDLTMTWRKHKSFTRSDKPMPRKIYYRATIPEIDAVKARDPEDRDPETADNEDAMGGDL